MANNFGVLTNTFLGYDVLELFLQNLLPLTNLTLDVTDRMGGRYARPGDVLTLKDLSSNFSTYQVGANGYVAPDYVAGPDVTITLPNSPTAVSFYLTAPEFRLIEGGVHATTDYATFRDRIARKMVNGLGVKMVNDFLATITKTAFAGATVSAAGTFSRATEVDLDAALFSRNVSTDGAMGILSVPTYSEWAKDHIIIQSYTGEDQRRLLLDGGVNDGITAINFWRTSLPMPANSDRGFVITPEAIIFASRIPDEPSTGDRDPVSLSEITDPRTGITLLQRMWKSAQTGTIQMDFSLIYAFGATQSPKVQRIVSTASLQ